MDIVTLAAEWWVKWAFGLIGAGIVAGFTYLRKKQKAQEIRQTAIENGMQAILRDRILTSYYHYHERGNITLHGLENVECMYKSYHELGGNGTMTHLVQTMREMEVVDE